MNERQYYQTRIAYYSVLGFLFGVMALVPGIDSVGHTIMGVLFGIMLAFTAYSIFRMRRASTSVPVYSAATLHTAPPHAQFSFWRRAGWVVPAALGLLTIMAGFDFQQLESGEVKSVSIMIPFNLVYSAFGATVTICCMAACAVGSFIGIRWITHRIVSTQAAANQEGTMTPPKTTNNSTDKI